MKLELKHLFAYLEYNIKIMWYDSKEVYGISFEEWDHENNLYPLDTLIYTLKYNEKQEWGLILHPLSDLTKEIEVNGENINVIEEIYNESWMALGYEFRDTKYCYQIVSNEDFSTLEIFKNKPKVNMYWVNEILFKYHFDVFGLIEKGLAIDINIIN